MQAHGVGAPTLDAGINRGWERVKRALRSAAIEICRVIRHERRRDARDGHGEEACAAGIERVQQWLHVVDEVVARPGNPDLRCDRGRAPNAWHGRRENVARVRRCSLDNLARAIVDHEVDVAAQGRSTIGAAVGNGQRRA